MGRPPSRLGFLYSWCPTSSVGRGCALAGSEGRMSWGCREARSLLAAVTEQAVVLVLCLSPTFQSVDGEVVPTVPSLASAGSPWQPGGMLCPEVALQLPSPLCPSSLAVGRGRPSIRTKEAFSFFWVPVELGICLRLQSRCSDCQAPFSGSSALTRLCGLGGGQSLEHAPNLASCYSPSRKFEQSLKIAKPT